MTLGCQVINFFWLNFLNQTNEACTFGKVTLVEKRAPRFMRVLINVVYTSSIEGTASPFYSMHFVPLVEEKFS